MNSKVKAQAEAMRFYEATKTPQPKPTGDDLRAEYDALEAEVNNWPDGASGRDEALERMEEIAKTIYMNNL